MPAFRNTFSWLVKCSDRDKPRTERPKTPPLVQKCVEYHWSISPSLRL